MQVEVEVEAGYPFVPPRFSLKLLKHGPRKAGGGGALLVDADPRALSAATLARQGGEAADVSLAGVADEVNLFAPADAAAAGCPGGQLLAWQMQALVGSFGVYVDVESGLPVSSARPHRGRDRRLPLVYSPAARLLDHRI